jgi:hypothetical protein
MSALCPASGRILALNDDDLAYLRDNNIDKPLSRVICDELDCNVTFNVENHPHGRLAADKWQGNPLKLCGSCAFCNVLLDGIQQTLDSKSWSWRLESTLLDSEDIRVVFAFNVQEYHKESPPWAVTEKRLSTWNVYLMSLSGNIIPRPPNIESGNDSPIRWYASRQEIEVGFELFAEENNPAAQFLSIHRRPLDASPLSEANTSKILRWMKDCDETHERCWVDVNRNNQNEASKDGYFLPTRLVDVGDPLTCEPPRLVVTSDLGGNKRERLGEFNYMALSYCWGDPKDSSRLLRTTHSTIRTRLKSIEVEVMPQVFKDAVRVARTLGIRYVWIDSLCIIQDDPSDWQVESSRMAEIFSNAHLTVIAATGESCHDSFLHRGLGVSCPVLVGSKVLGLVGGRFGLRYRLHRATDKMAEIKESRWITRGWTFQEERLARRALLFAKDKFFLDCKTSERVEDTEMYRLRPSWVKSISEMPGEEPSIATMKGRKAASQWHAAFAHWQTLCSHYSYRELAFPADKLPAISGMASKFSNKLRCDYLGGLWRDRLAHGLFWYTTGSSTRPEEYRAPSWSWASLDGRISWPSWRSCEKQQCQMYCTILEARTTTLGLDAFGAVKNGELKVSGALLKVEALTVVDGGSRSQWRLFFQGREVAKASPDIETELREEESYWALLFAKCKADKKTEPRARGLLLETNGQKESLELFQRVGVFTVSADCFTDSVDPDMRESESKLYKSIGFWENLEKRTITIV